MRKSCNQCQYVGFMVEFFNRSTRIPTGKKVYRQCYNFVPYPLTYCGYHQLKAIHQIYLQDYELPPTPDNLL